MNKKPKEIAKFIKNNEKKKKKKTNKQTKVSLHDIISS